MARFKFDISRSEIQKQIQKTHPQFQIKVGRRRSVWQDLALFVGVSMGTWGGSHLFLNYDAFAQIFAFKVDQLKTSVFAHFEPAPLEIQVPEPLPATQVKKPTPKINPKNPHQKLLSQMEIYPSDNRVVIPRIGKSVPLVTVPSHKNWQQLEQNIQSGLQNGVVVHPVSRAPGSFGNFFITGHSSYYKWDPGRFKDVFALLHEVKVGDLVEVYWEGQKYVYKIRDSKVVPPTQVSVLHQPASQKILTLMTCTPVGTNKDRLILTGELKS